MGKFVDLTGKRIGKLVVESIDCRKNNRIFWNCQCDCGNKKSIMASCLQQERTKSCGCLQIEIMSIIGKKSCKNIIGEKFGRLTVIEYCGKSKWRCRCECGNEKIAKTGDLKNSKTKSCGCLRSDNLIGQKFGRLLVLKKEDNYVSPKGTTQSMWLCQCDCGNTTIVHNGSLKNGKTTSCGCWNKEKPSPTKLKYGEASINYIYDTYKRGAKNRKLIFELSKNFFKEITQENCVYCGEIPKNLIKSNWDNGDYIYNGIDRINSSKGYTEDNVVPSCGRCNIAKMSETQEDFLDWNKRVIIHQSKSWTEEEFENFINKMREARKSCQQ